MSPPMGRTLPLESVKDLHVTLPPGFIGDPTATPRCREADFNNELAGGPACPASTQVGVLYLSAGGDFSDPIPVSNSVPPPGVPAVFGFNISQSAVRLVGSVRTAGDYGVTVDVKDTSQYLGLVKSRLTFWGDTRPIPAMMPIATRPATTAALPVTRRICRS